MVWKLKISPVHEMMDEVLESSEYYTRRTKVAEWNKENKILKRGIAFNPIKFGISHTYSA